MLWPPQKLTSREAQLKHQQAKEAEKQASRRPHNTAKAVDEQRKRASWKQPVAFKDI